jgi:hypothetical protein
MRRIAPVLAIASLVVVSGAAATTQSGLRGIVTRGPTTPICVAGQACDTPVPGLTLVFTRGGSQAARTRTSPTGTYRIALAPGLYSVTSLPARRLEPTRARVIAGRVSRLAFSIDTGIR